MPRVHHRLLSSVIALLCSAVPIWAVESIKFDFSGAPSSLDAELRAVSLLESLGDADGAQDVLSKAKAEYGILLDTLYAQGYYGPVIHITLDGREAADIAPLDAPAKISAVLVQVQVGPQFTLSRADIAPLAAFTALPPGFAKGQIARSTVIVDAATAAVGRWRDRGFAKARVADQSLVADHKNATLAADVQIDQGRMLHFGALILHGTESMKVDRVQAIAGLPQGAVYSPAELDRVATRLRRTGAFRSVSLSESDAISPSDRLDITANLVEEKVRRYRLTGEVASTQGLSLSGQWMHRNLLGGAEKLTVTGDVNHLGLDTGGLDYSLGLGFERPATFTPDTTLTLGAVFDHQKDNAQTETALNLRGGLTHYFSNTLTLTASLAYHISQVNDPSGDSEFRTLALPIGATWDTRAVKKNATDGVAISAEVKPFYGLGYGDNGVRLVWDARGYKSVTKDDKLVLAARFQAGAIFGASLAGTPRDDLFFSGGPATVRGQPYKSLGVYQLTDSGGTPFLTGGTHFLAGSMESRLRIGRNLGLVGFVDVGHVDAAPQFSFHGGWQAGAGVGLRYLTTIGPIRLDVAGPVQGNTGNGLQIYVGLGQAF